MTNETARQEIESLDYYLQNHTDDYSEESHTAMMMATKALEQEPCEDCVRRSDVMVLIEDTNLKHLSFIRGISQKAFEDLLNGAQALPPVTPQPKTGHWILTDDDFVYCSECEDSYYPRPIDTSWYYCPHCGARMVEP